MFKSVQKFPRLPTLLLWPPEDARAHACWITVPHLGLLVREDRCAFRLIARLDKRENQTQKRVRKAQRRRITGPTVHARACVCAPVRLRRTNPRLVQMTRSDLRQHSRSMGSELHALRSNTHTRAHTPSESRTAARGPGSPPARTPASRRHSPRWRWSFRRWTWATWETWGIRRRVRAARAAELRGASAQLQPHFFKKRPECAKSARP